MGIEKSLFSQPIPLDSTKGHISSATLTRAFLSPLSDMVNSGNTVQLKFQQLQRVEKVQYEYLSGTRCFNQGMEDPLLRVIINCVLDATGVRSPRDDSCSSAR